MDLGYNYIDYNYIIIAILLTVETSKLLYSALTKISQIAK